MSLYHELFVRVRLVFEHNSHRVFETLDAESFDLLHATEMFYMPKHLRYM